MSDDENSEVEIEEAQGHITRVELGPSIVMFDAGECMIEVNVNGVHVAATPERWVQVLEDHSDASGWTMPLFARLLAGVVEAGDAVARGEDLRLEVQEEIDRLGLDPDGGEVETVEYFGEQMIELSAGGAVILATGAHWLEVLRQQPDRSGWSGEMLGELFDFFAASKGGAN